MNMDEFELVKIQNEKMRIEMKITKQKKNIFSLLILDHFLRGRGTFWPTFRQNYKTLLLPPLSEKGLSILIMSKNKDRKIKEIHLIFQELDKIPPSHIIYMTGLF